jgi:WD40 repeat protein/tetratricopeptide (TPR) repeat protein
MSSTASDEVALAETDEESNEISATLDALDNAKRVGEFDHWRAAKLNKRMRKRFAERKAEMEAKIFHEKEMIKKRHHRMQVARKAAWRKERKEAEEILNQQKSLGLIMTASCKTWESEEKLREMETGYKNTIGKMHDKLRGLDELTHRIKKLRQEINKEADIKSASKELADDIEKTEVSPFVNCPVCKQRVLKYRYKTHKKKCDERAKENGRETSQLAVAIKEENFVGVLKPFKTTPCSICERPVMSERIAEHTRKCQAREAERQRIVPSYEAPQSPQNFQVCGNSTSWSVPLSWEPPLFNGGLPIFEYEIQYSYCEKEVVGKKIIRHYIKQEPVLCARWCHKTPVPSFGFNLEHLKAGAEYVNFSVRARNDVGWGEPSNVIETVSLKVGSKPSPPLFLRHKPPLVTSCTLFWCAPLRTGGSPIKEYKISYKCVMVEEVAGAGFGGRPEESEQTITILTGSPTLSHNVEGLVSDIEYTDLTVQAINEDGHESEISNTIETLKGAAADRTEKFRQELMRATKSESAWIDSDMFYGFMQRFGRRQYIKLVKFELEDLGDEEYVRKYEIDYPMESSSEDEEDEWDSSNEDVESKVELKRAETKKEESPSTQSTPTKLDVQKYGAFANEHRIRTKHFKFRMNKLQGAVDRAAKTKEECLARRSEIIFALRKTEKRIASVRGELDRSLAFKGGFMDSTIVHGGGHLQRFTTTGLSAVLQKTLNELLDLTTRGKHELIQIENTMKKMGVLKEESEMAFKERQAALYQFEKDVQHRIKEQRKAGEKAKTKGSLLGGTGATDARVMRRLRVKEIGWVFETWLDFVIRRRHEKHLMRNFLRGATNALLSAGLTQWKLFIKENKKFQELGSGDSSTSGQGSILLKKVDFLRRSNMTEALSALRRLRETRSEVERLTVTPIMEKALEDSPFYDSEKKMIEDNRSAATSAKDDNKRLTSVDKIAIKADHHAEVTQGDIYFRQGDYAKAEVWFEKYKGRAIFDNRVFDQCKVWLRLGNLHIATAHFEKACVAFRNVRLLVAETEGSHRLKGEAEMGSARAFHELGKYKVGNDHYMKALTIWMKLSDRAQEIETCKGLVYGYDKVGDTDKAEIYEKRFKSLEWRNISEYRIEQGKYKLSTMRKTLLGSSTMPVDTLRIERVSSNVPRMRLKIEKQEDLIFRTKVEQEIKKAQLSGSKRLHSRMTKEMNRVRKLELDEIDSTLITGTNQRYEREELLERLKIAEEETYKKKSEEEKEYHRLSILISNAEDDISYMKEEITADTGELIQRVNAGRNFRCFALNGANAQTNDVLGGNSGGVPSFVAACDNMVLVFDILFVSCIAVLNDDPLGHQKTILCLRYHEYRAYSGGADNFVCVWELDKTKAEYLTCVGRLEGHTGSIWTIDVDTVKVVTGSTDCSVRIWDVETLECLRVVDRPHVRTIMCIKIGPDLLATGGADTHVKMWELESTYKVPYKHVNLFRRLRGGRYGGHQGPVTCLEFAASELVSGDRLGTILVWNISTGLVLRNLQGSHKHAVRDLKFDATKIISVGNDGLVLITDISTGEHLQSLHGHKKEVLTLAYDSKEILTLSVDGDIRHWRFPITDQASKYKWHLLQPGESLKTLRIKYGHPVSKIKAWNNIKDVITDVYSGMRLIVDEGGTGDIYERQNLELKKKEEAKAREMKEVQARLKAEFKQAAKDTDKEFSSKMYAAPTAANGGSISKTKKKDTAKSAGDGGGNADDGEEEKTDGGVEKDGGESDDESGSDSGSSDDDDSDDDGSSSEGGSESGSDQ